jgi:peptidoglycan/LPS O-acetylase OafA/YrhL
MGLGSRGVDLFFCLSGFLITGILVAAKGHTHFFRNFYARRTVRIFPLYYFFLLVYYLLVVRFHVVNFGAAKLSLVAEDLHWVWFYGTNILIARQGHFITPTLNHFWTLAVEEHFYLVWPFVVFALRRRQLLIASGVLMGACLVLRVVLMVHGTPGQVIETLSPCRADSFAMGAAASLLLESARWRERLDGVTPALLGGCLLVGLGTYWFSERAYTSIGITAVSLFFTLLIVFAVLRDRSYVAAGLRWAPMRFLGKYSYALYVFHWPVQVVIDRKLPVEMIRRHTHSLPLAILVNMALVGIPSVLIALGTWNLLEKHCLRLKRFFPEPKSIVSSAVEGQREGILAA